MGDADHGLRALLYPNLHGKNFPTAVWLGSWGSYGPLSAADTQPPPSSAVSFFFRDLAFFGDSERSGFAGHDGRTDDDETGLPPDPLLRTENRQNFIAKNFFCDFKSTKKYKKVPKNIKWWKRGKL